MVVLRVVPVGAVSTYLRRSLVRRRGHVDVAASLASTSSSASSTGATAVVIAQCRWCPRGSPRRWTRKWPRSAAVAVVNAAVTAAAGFARWSRRWGGPLVGHRVLRDGSIRGGALAVLAVGRVAAVGLGVR
uniref:(northern house mosquito) hypothetical protein n=1 Tax=Culex pipiens TaxID=7175 RepID=A0A8D8EWP2_CULPI